jgi:hypothetical protein
VRADLGRLRDRVEVSRRMSDSTARPAETLEPLFDPQSLESVGWYDRKTDTSRVWDPDIEKYVDITGLPPRIPAPVPPREGFPAPKFVEIEGKSYDLDDIASMASVTEVERKLGVNPGSAERLRVMAARYLMEREHVKFMRDRERQQVELLRDAMLERTQAAIMRDLSEASRKLRALEQDSLTYAAGVLIVGTGTLAFLLWPDFAAIVGGSFMIVVWPALIVVLVRLFWWDIRDRLAKREHNREEEARRNQQGSIG